MHLLPIITHVCSILGNGSVHRWKLCGRTPCLQCLLDPTIGETLHCESENAVDPYAVAVLEIATIVGHVPRKISAACNLFLRRSGSTIQCMVTGIRCYSADLPQGELEVPRELTFQGDPT